MQEINKSQESLNSARNRFRPLAERAAMLFFLVKDLTKLEYVYQFSLKWFMDLFEKELITKDKEFVSTSELDPVVDLTNRLTMTVYSRICLSVFQRDKLLVAFMIAYRLMKWED